MPLTKSMSAGEVIHDFVHSKNPKFAGKSKAERRRMALGAYYSKHPEKSNEETEMSEPTTPTLFDLVTDKNAVGFQEAISDRLSAMVSVALDDAKGELQEKMFNEETLSETTGKKLHAKNVARDAAQAHEHEFITAHRQKHGMENTKVETVTAKNGSPITSTVYLTKNKKKIPVATWDHKNAVGSYREAV